MTSPERERREGYERRGERGSHREGKGKEVVERNRGRAKLKGGREDGHPSLMSRQNFGLVKAGQRRLNKAINTALPCYA